MRIDIRRTKDIDAYNWTTIVLPMTDAATNRFIELDIRLSLESLVAVLYWIGRGEMGHAADAQRDASRASAWL